MRPAAAAAVLGLALAVGTPTVWELTRPSAAAGAPVEQALPPARTPAPVPASPPGGTPAPDRLPTATARDARPSVPAPVAAPARLVVPALGVDTEVSAVGVQDDGQMAIPADVDRVGWYRFGPAPGGPGSAVLAGHVDDAEQGLGAMAPLRGASVGDEIRVTDSDGTTTRWRVLSRELIRKQVLPLDRLFARTGEPRLTLITCGGPFLPEYRSYRDNVVVVAAPLGGVPG